MYRASNAQYKHAGVGATEDAAVREWYERNAPKDSEFTEISRMTVDGTQRRTYYLKAGTQYSETVVLWIHKTDQLQKGAA